MTVMTSVSISQSSHKVPGIKHKCLRRKSRRTYELLDPKRPGEAVSFDIGQVREIVLMDKRLREEGVVRSVPAGYTEFAQRFNQYTTGRERFATYSFVHGRYVIHKDGSPIAWEDFLIDDSLFASNADFMESPSSETSASPTTQKDGKPTSGIDVNSIPLQQLSARMKEAMKTTDELSKFWLRRGAIEHEYASRLARLSETQFGANEPAEFRSVIDALRIETAKQAMNRHELAKQFAVDLESRCVNLQLKQSAHWNQIYEPTSMKLRKFLQPESPQTDGVSVEWRKEYNNMRHPIDALRREAIQQSEHATGLSRHDSFDDILARPTTNQSKPSSGWTNEWATLRISCERLEADRSEFMKGLLTAYADALSTIRAAQNESCNTINFSLDLFRPQDVVDDFIQTFGGNETLVEDVDLQASPTHFSHNPVRKGKEQITAPSVRVPLPTPSTRNETVRRSRVKISTTSEAGPQPSSNNEGVMVINVSAKHFL
ncbi:hypothetical protein M413DRAFT_178049 [Hebeloma cylindrosporum]|uniref:FCH domain-containing protein n=1 Tax=Hebeloma cylindrosporum TaxID=76867 RepID=A0A0C3C9U5_HEBCY|nr:hypothetical protein M413DRAFT_178049 [Hebeloma cylindrosporum h7]